MSFIQSASSKPKKAPTEITEEFKAYCAAWVEKVVVEEVQEACFPNDIDKFQRQVSGCVAWSVGVRYCWYLVCWWRWCCCVVVGDVVVVMLVVVVVMLLFCYVGVFLLLLCSRM